MTDVGTLPLAAWAPAGKRSAEVGDVEVELERAGLWFGCSKWDQRRARIPAVGCLICRHVEGALQGPVVEGHRQALADQRVGVIDQPEVQMGAGRITGVAEQPQALAAGHAVACLHRDAARLKMRVVSVDTWGDLERDSVAAI